MSISNKSVVQWLVLWAVLLLGLTVQACLDLRMLSESLNSEIQTTAMHEVEYLCGQIRLAEARAEQETDAFLARPVVLEALETRPRIRAAAVYDGGQVLEAQIRMPDGTLAPMTDESIAEEVQALLPLEEGREIQVWIALDGRPFADIAAKRSRKACLHLAGCALGTGAMLLAVFWLARRRQA